MERKENDRKEEGRKGVSNRTSKVEKKKEGGSRLQRGMWIRNLKLKGTNKKYFTPT